MTSDKQILTIHWKPNKLTIVLVLASILLCVFLPTYFSATYILPLFIFAFLQISITVFISLFFYSGISKADKIKATSALLAITALYASIVAVANQAFFISDEYMVFFDVVSFLTMNGAAAITILSLTKISKLVVERQSKSITDTQTAVEKLAIKTKPLYVSILVLLSFALFSMEPPIYFADANFSVTVVFFYYMQMLTSLIFTYFCFGDKNKKEQYRIFFTILSLALLIGAFANYDHDQIIPKVGHRIMVSSATFVVMNLGSLLTVLAFHLWKDYAASIMSKVKSPEQAT